MAVLLAGFPGIASAQVNCDAIPKGPARTDCYLGASQFYRGQSDLAAAKDSTNKRMAERLLQAIRAQESQKRFTQEGFRWLDREADGT